MAKYFSIGELCQSNVADLKGIPNHPNTLQKMNMEKLINHVLDPIRSLYGSPVYVNSGFRSETLNKVIGGARNSQHMQGKAADITTGSPKANKKLWDVILFLQQEGDIDFDQLINEKPIYVKEVGECPSWIHISYNEDNNRGQILTIR
jgi:uncharacterized protein YcbK (DUF882 family)